MKKNKRYFGSLLFFVLFLIMLAFYISNNRVEEKVCISEICPHNKTVKHNFQGYYYDYIEIHNLNNETLDLGDYYLSDNKDNLFKYKLDYYVIEPNGYVLVFCDPLVTGFKLADKETVYLTNSKGKVVDKVKLPSLEDNQSYGYDKEKDTWSICVPTPREDNVFSETKKDYIEPPVSMVSSGIYKTSFSVELKADNNIYYTLDGTKPTLDSTLYTEPIYIYDRSNEENKLGSFEEITTLWWHYFNESPTVKGTVLRAVCIDKNGNVSNEIVETYFVGIEEKEGYNELPIISLITDPDNLFGYENGIYVKGQVYDAIGEDNQDNEFMYGANYRMNGSGWKRKAYIQYISDNKTSIDEVEIDIHGAYSRAYTQKSFNVSKSINNSNSLFFNCFGINSSSLVLKSCGCSASFLEDVSTRMRDIVGQDIVKGLNFKTQESKMANLYIDGEYWGVYNIQERIDLAFIAERYGTETDNIEIVKYSNGNGEVISQTETETNEFDLLAEFVENNDMSKNDNYRYFCSQIDVDSFIDYYAVELYLNNNDWLNNNFAVWRSKEKINDEFLDGKWKFIVYDLDQTVGVYGETLPDDNPFFEPTGERKNIWILSSLLENQDFRESFINRFIEIINTQFSYERVLKIMDESFCSNSASLVESQKRFFDSTYSIDEFDNEAKDYELFFLNRSDYVVDSLKALEASYQYGS